LCSVPGDPWFQLAHPAEQQDSEQRKKQTDKHTICVHKATLLGESGIVRRNAQIARGRALRARSLQKAWADRSLAEKPKMGGLQMDWLRSEDLKEVKVVTAPLLSIAVRRRFA
jgi:hypothetical protein